MICTAEPSYPLTRTPFPNVGSRQNASGNREYCVRSLIRHGSRLSFFPTDLKDPRRPGLKLHFPTACSNPPQSCLQLTTPFHTSSIRVPAVLCHMDLSPESRLLTGNVLKPPISTFRCNYIISRYGVGQRHQKFPLTSFNNRPK